MIDTAVNVNHPQNQKLSQRGAGNFPAGVVEVNVERASDLDEALQDAFTILFGPAMEVRTGIMVTRIGVGRYIVQVHPEVPAGLIRQRHV